MRRVSTFLVLLALVAFTCDLGGACALAMEKRTENGRENGSDNAMASHDAAEACCCCPAAACDAPCMESEDEAPQPPAHAATLDGPISLAVLANAPATLASPVPRCAPGPSPVADPSAGTGPALYLLDCSFLN